jgi:hypothetical protein
VCVRQTRAWSWHGASLRAPCAALRRRLEHACACRWAASHGRALCTCACGGRSLGGPRAFEICEDAGAASSAWCAGHVRHPRRLATTTKKAQQPFLDRTAACQKVVKPRGRTKPADQKLTTSRSFQFKASGGCFHCSPQISHIFDPRSRARLRARTDHEGRALAKSSASGKQPHRRRASGTASARPSQPTVGGATQPRPSPTARGSLVRMQPSAARLGAQGGPAPVMLGAGLRPVAAAPPSAAALRQGERRLPLAPVAAAAPLSRPGQPPSPRGAKPPFAAPGLAGAPVQVQEEGAVQVQGQQQQAQRQQQSRPRQPPPSHLQRQRADELAAGVPEFPWPARGDAELPRLVPLASPGSPGRDGAGPGPRRRRRAPRRASPRRRAQQQAQAAGAVGLEERQAERTAAARPSTPLITPRGEDLSRWERRTSCAWAGVAPLASRQATSPVRAARRGAARRSAPSPDASGGGRQLAAGRPVGHARRLTHATNCGGPCPARPQRWYADATRAAEAEHAAFGAASPGGGATLGEDLSRAAQVRGRRVPATRLRFEHSSKGSAARSGVSPGGTLGYTTGPRRRVSEAPIRAHRHPPSSPPASRGWTRGCLTAASRRGRSRRWRRSACRPAAPTAGARWPTRSRWPAIGATATAWAAPRRAARATCLPSGRSRRSACP